MLLSATHRPGFFAMLAVLATSVSYRAHAATAARPHTPAEASFQSPSVAGQWQFKNDDGTYEERLELTVTGDQLRGTLEAYEHGYFSRRTTNTASLRIEGTVRNGRVTGRLIDASSGTGRDAEFSRRGAYLVLRSGGRTTGYARPGTPLVQDGEGSPEALALAKALVGRIYQSGTQASGRGSFVGGRLRLALCENGEIAYDESDLASVPGASPGATSSMGSSMSRRGRWTVVLFAGAPMVMARWNGSGSSYSLTAYFDVQPAADGKSIELDGKRLPVTGRC